MNSALVISSPPQQQQFSACEVSFRPSGEKTRTSRPLIDSPSSAAAEGPLRWCEVCSEPILYTVRNIGCERGIFWRLFPEKSRANSDRNDRIHSGSEQPADASR